MRLGVGDDVAKQEGESGIRFGSPVSVPVSGGGAWPYARIDDCLRPLIYPYWGRLSADVGERALFDLDDEVSSVMRLLTLSIIARWIMASELVVRVS